MNYTRPLRYMSRIWRPSLSITFNMCAETVFPCLFSLQHTTSDDIILCDFVFIRKGYAYHEECYPYCICSRCYRPLFPGYSDRRSALYLRSAGHHSRNRRVRVDTHEGNIPMRKMLEKNGFEYCGTIHLLDGQPRVAYEKLV